MKYKKIYLEITNICNLNCSFCIGNKRKTMFMDKSMYLAILEKIKPYTKYLYFHVLGEPLMHPNINNFIDLATTNNFYVNITTNGYLIKKIENNRNIRQLNISLHSFDDKYGISLEQYLQDIFEVTDNLRQNGTYISFRLWVKSKYHKQIIDCINNYYNENVSDNVENYTLKENVFINNFHEFIWPDLDNNYYCKKGTCYALRDHIGILVDGTIVPCCLDTLGVINLGNILKNEFKDVIASKRYQNMLEGFKNHEKTEELCKHCSFLKKNRE